MSIVYTYTIKSVDEPARCMEVVYSADGLQTMHMGVRLPFEGESLESVIEAFAPIALWVEMATPVYAPAVGTVGQITAPDVTQGAEAEVLVLTVTAVNP
jgi:hypothetical protein